jgi:tetratricopeptide (TPR) repeat protein
VGKLMKAKIISAFVITVILIIIAGLIGKDEIKDIKEKVSPVDISLTYIQGTDNILPLLKIRLFSRYLQQKAIDIESAGKKEKVESFKVHCPRSMWEKDMYIVFSDNENSGYEKKKGGIKAVKIPEQEELTISPEAVYLAIYELSSDIRSQKGKRIRAEVKIGKYDLKSNYVEIPAPLVDEKEKLANKARIEMCLEKNKELLETADKMILQNAEDPSGYWYKGIALENEKKYKEAIVEYEKALRKYPRPSQSDNEYEPPLRLVQKIKELREKIK